MLYFVRFLLFYQQEIKQNLGTLFKKGFLSHSDTQLLNVDTYKQKRAQKTLQTNRCKVLGQNFMLTTT